MTTDPPTVTKYVTFSKPYPLGTRWDAAFWDVPYDYFGKCYRIRIPVPPELWDRPEIAVEVSQEVEGE